MYNSRKSHIYTFQVADQVQVLFTGFCQFFWEEQQLQRHGDALISAHIDKCPIICMHFLARLCNSDLIIWCAISPCFM